MAIPRILVSPNLHLCTPNLKTLASTESKRRLRPLAGGNPKAYININ
jgi:hypothetical protein